MVQKNVQFLIINFKKLQISGSTEPPDTYKQNSCPTFHLFTQSTNYKAQAELVQVKHQGIIHFIYKSDS